MGSNVSWLARRECLGNLPNSLQRPLNPFVFMGTELARTSGRAPAPIRPSRPLHRPRVFCCENLSEGILQPMKHQNVCKLTAGSARDLRLLA